MNTAKCSSRSVGGLFTDTAMEVARCGYWEGFGSRNPGVFHSRFQQLERSWPVPESLRPGAQQSQAGRPPANVGSSRTLAFLARAS